jgi:hypothetical protein
VISLDLSSGFVLDGDLAQHQPLLRGPGTDQVQGRLAGRPVEGPAQGLAVHGHHARDGLSEAPHEAEEAVVEACRVEVAEQAGEGVVARDAVAQRQELPEERRLVPTEQGHVRAVLGAAQHGAEGDQQDFVQIVPCVGRARILQVIEAGDELLHGALQHRPP